MLNLIREQKHRFKWVLWLVIIGLTVGMVLMFVAGPSKQGGQESLGNFVAKVGDQEISVSSFRSSLLTLLNYLGPQARSNPNMMKQYGTMTLMQKVRTIVSAQEAQRLGFSVSDAELEHAIVTSPSFTVNGRFIGTKEYKERLRRLGMSTEEYESEIRMSLLNQKLQDFISAAASVSDEEVKARYEQQNDKAKIRFASVQPMKFWDRIKPTADNLQAYYDQHKENYKIGETRQIRYLMLDTNKLAEKLVEKIPESEIRQEYDANKETRYPDMVRASHILIKVPKDASPEQVAELKKKAEDVLALARKPGADFAQLAMKYSEDTGSAKQGGDLNYFPRGRMVPAFEEKAFSMQPGEISDLVRTQFGFHIIKVTDRRGFDYYKNIIARNLARQKAETQLSQTAKQAVEAARSGKTLEAVAKEFGGQVLTSQPFNRDVTDRALGASPGLMEEVFALKDGEVGDMQETAVGIVVPKLVKIIPPHVQPFKDVENKVRQDYRNDEAKRLAREEAEQVVAALGGGGDFDAIVKKYSLLPEESNEFGVNDAISNTLKVQPELALAALQKNVDQVGGPVDINNQFIIFKVVDRQRPDMKAFEEQKGTLREQMLKEKRQQLYEAFSVKLMRRYQQENLIVINQPLLDQILS